MVYGQPRVLLVAGSRVRDEFPTRVIGGSGEWLRERIDFQGAEYVPLIEHLSLRLLVLKGDRNDKVHVYRPGSLPAKPDFHMGRIW